MKRIIVFEGIDHVGKSTLAGRVSAALKEQISPEVKIMMMSSPGKGIEGSLGDFVYKIHHNRVKDITEKMDPTALQMLHVASHLNNLQNRMLPHIKSSGVVILDRFWWSAIAYGIAAGISEPILYNIVSPEIELFNLVKEHLKVFYITRDNIDYDHGLTHGERIISEYKKIAKSSDYDVRTIYNDGTIEETVNLIIHHIVINNGKENEPM